MARRRRASPFHHGRSREGRRVADNLQELMLVLDANVVSELRRPEKADPKFA